MKNFSFPILIDRTTGKPSVSMMFVYFLFFPALYSSCVMAYHPTQEYFLGWACSNTSFLISYVFYRIRNMDTFQASAAGASIGINTGAPAITHTQGENSDVDSKSDIKF